MMFAKMYDTVKRWFGMLFNRSKEISKIIETEIDQDHYNRLEKWKAIYAGFYKEWHDLKVYTIENNNKKRRMHTLNMAKVSSQELAKLVFSERVEINIDDKALNDEIGDILLTNRFKKEFQEKLEIMFATGGIILKAVPKLQEDASYKLSITYVNPDCFIPTGWENGYINEGTFLNISRKDKYSYCLFESHKWGTVKDEDGNPIKALVVENKLFKTKDVGNARDGQQFKECPLDELYPGLQPRTEIKGLTHPLFQYFKPNIANNINLDSPMGIPIYANALDTLYALDVAFDSFIREFKLGVRRIIVPVSAVREIMDEATGETKRYFDASDEAYQAMSTGDNDDQKIQDNTVPLRVDEHIDAINALLNLYSMQTGFSPGSFTFDGGGVKTATEVVSENSKTYQTITSNDNTIEEGLKRFITMIVELGQLYEVFDAPDKFEIDFYWDDNVIGDKYTDADFFIKLKNAGVISKKYALSKILKFTDEQAQEMMAEIKDENRTVTQDVFDSTFGNEE